MRKCLVSLFSFFNCVMMGEATDGESQIKCKNKNGQRSEKKGEGMLNRRAEKGNRWKTERCRQSWNLGRANVATVVQGKGRDDLRANNQSDIFKINLQTPLVPGRYEGASLYMRLLGLFLLLPG